MNKKYLNLIMLCFVCGLAQEARSFGPTPPPVDGWPPPEDQWPVPPRDPRDPQPDPNPPSDPPPPPPEEVSCERGALSSEIEGFARGVTGGGNASTYWVTNLNNSGSGSLRQGAEASGSRVIRFRVNGTIKLNSPIRVKSDKTIDGSDSRVVISGEGLHMNKVKNVIITGLTFDKGNDDAIAIKDNVSKVLVHRNTFRNYKDGLVDITRGSTDVTVSWNRFENHDKTMLISADPSHGNMDRNTRVTIHHNFFNKTKQRHPRVRFAKVHVYNNYFYHLGSYGVGASMDSELVVQNNIFESDRNKDAVVTKVGDDPRHGSVRAQGNWLINGARITERNAGQVFDPNSFYPASNIEHADARLRNFLRECSGDPSFW